MKNQYQKLLKISLWTVIIVFSVRCALSWQTIVNDFSLYNLWGYAGEAIGLASVFVILYERYLWRINPFEKTPKLAKQYTGTLTSHYDNIERPATIEIQQTLFSIKVFTTTSESKSASLSASIDDFLGETQLTYCYLNTPKTAYRHRSEVHYGTAILCIKNPQKITGQYYTDRKTLGDMTFTAVSE